MARPRVPTINDLRVKLCYICREEESADTPQIDAPRAWTHPCNCTLIAHEECLLKWIRTSQGNSSRAANALKCPQCGASYEIDSDKPLVLRILTTSNKVLQRLGRYLTVFGAAASVGIIGTSIYICLTAYGAWAVEKFIGKDMYDLVLTEDPVNWPWSAYINLPLLPIALILSRFSNSSTSLVIPLLLVWPPSPPVGESARRLYAYWSLPENASRLAQLPSLSASSASSRVWPPPPVLFGLIGVPIVRAIYRRCFSWLYKRLLGIPLPKPRRMPRGGLRFNEGPFVIRIMANDEENAGQGGEQQQVMPGGLPDAPVQRVGGEGNANANAEDDAEADPNAAMVAEAEQVIDANAASLGRRIGGALVIPAISHLMGTLLYRLSKHSCLLRTFLGIRDFTSTHPQTNWVSALLGRIGGGKTEIGDDVFFNKYPQPPWGRLISPSSDPQSMKVWSELGAVQKTRVGMRLMVNAVLGGSRAWIESDPVWWRNGVGFALFIAAKDCIQLLHLWLTKRELESRRVKDRDFSGVDVKELDLLPSYFYSTLPP